MVQDEEQMSNKKTLERKTLEANEARDTASERFWHTWDLVATERQRAFLLHVGALRHDMDDTLTALPKPERRQEYRRLMRIHLNKEIEAAKPSRKESANEAAA